MTITRAQKEYYGLIKRLGTRYISTHASMESANEAVRKLVYNDLKDWIEVNKAIRGKTHKYIIMPVFVDDDIEDEYNYSPEVDCYVIAKRASE